MSARRRAVFGQQKKMNDSAMTTHDLARTQPEASERGYNLFRNKQRPELFCAVPEDYPVPRFVIDEGWLFERPLRPTDTPPPGFHTKAASAGVRFNGFYVFQLIKSG
jgi:hypothetical protein